MVYTSYTHTGILTYKDTESSKIYILIKEFNDLHLLPINYHHLKCLQANTNIHII